VHAPTDPFAMFALAPTAPGKSAPMRENECNDVTDNHCEFAMIIYQSYLLTYLVSLI